MNELQSVARLKIHDGKLDEFKRLAAKCYKIRPRQVRRAVHSFARQRFRFSNAN